MTRRDTFAAAALTGLLAAPTDKDRSMEYWARLAYEAADAMLRERTSNNNASPIVPSRDTAGGVTSPPGSSGGHINRSAERQSPAYAGGGEPRGVPRPDTKGKATGGPGHFDTPEAIG